MGRGGRPGTDLRSSSGLCPAAPSPDALGPVTQLEEDANLIPACWKNVGKVIPITRVPVPVSPFASGTGDGSRWSLSLVTQTLFLITMIAFEGLEL